MRSLSATRKQSGLTSKLTAVLGSQWGDEGKGKLVDVLAEKYDLICRFNGGSNAGHTLVVDGKKYAFHLLPCGMLYKNKINVIGNGVVLHIPTLFKELGQLDKANIEYADTLKVSDRAHLLFDFHRLIDSLEEQRLGGKEIGTTKNGIGPCYASKSFRNGLRVAELFGSWSDFESRYRGLLEYYQRQYEFDFDADGELERLEGYKSRLRGFTTDTVFLVNQALREGKSVLAEGANACMLDLDFGTYPFVTSSSTTAGGISTGLGIPPCRIESSVGVVKAYTTRVGGGPFPSELFDEIGSQLVEVGKEYGTTTGRRRRCGWLDVPVLQYSMQINGYSSLNMTKLDVLDNLDEIKIATKYSLKGVDLKPGQFPVTLEDLGQVEVEYESFKGWKCDISQCRSFDQLPVEAQTYLDRVGKLVGVPISWIGVGPGRDDMVLNVSD